MHADGLTHSPAVRDGSSVLSDGFSIVKFTTRLATKSTVIHQLAKLLERLASAIDPQTNNPCCVLIKSLGGTSASGDAEIVMSAFQEVKRIPTGVPDIALFFRTLGADGGRPPGHEKEFSTLGPVLNLQRNVKTKNFINSTTWRHPFS